MKLFKKNKTSDVKKSAQTGKAKFDIAETSELEPGTLSKEDQRRLDFLEMLAEEKELHQQKMNESHTNAPLTEDSRDEQISSTATLKPSEENVQTPEPTPTDRASELGLGGESFLTAGSNFENPNLEANLKKDTPKIDVTAKPKNEPFIDTVNPSIDMGQPLTRRINMGDLRLDVARITSDIDNGEALYRRAHQRVGNLMSFVERAEVDFSLLDRLEPENRRLKARNRTLSSEVETQSHKINVIQADLEEHRRRLAEVKAQHETANGSLTRSMKAVADRDREIKRLNEELNSLSLKLDRVKTAGEVETRENAVLRDRVAQLSDTIEDLKAERSTFSKMSESLKIDCDDYRSTSDRLQSEVHDLRHALDAAQKSNNQMKGEMVALHEEITTFKTQYEFNIISRDDRIYSLEAQIEDLSKQLEIKDEIIANASKDVSELRKHRTTQELERERLEKLIQGQSTQLDDAQAQLLKSKQHMQELDQRYSDVTAALSVTQARRDAQIPVANPDIQPISSPEQSQDTALTQIDLSDNIDGDETTQSIEDRIMDYKLGLRKNIF